MKSAKLLRPVGSGSKNLLQLIASGLLMHVGRIRHALLWHRTTCRLGSQMLEMLAEAL